MLKDKEDDGDLNFEIESKDRDLDTPGVKVIDAYELLSTQIEYQSGTHDDEMVNPYCQKVYYRLCYDSSCNEELMNKTEKGDNIENQNIQLMDYD